MYRSFTRTVQSIFLVAFFLTPAIIKAQPVATYTAPIDLATNLSVTPTFNWTIAAGTPPYTSIIEIATDNLFNNIVDFSNVGGGLTYTVTSPLDYNTTYYWRVNVTDDVSATNTPDIYSFTTLPAASVSLLTPADGNLNTSRTPNFSWSISNGTGPYTSMIHYSTDPLLAGALTHFAGNSTSAQFITLAYSTTYYWKVVVTDTHGDVQESAINNFTLVDPVVVTNTSPADLDELVSLTPTLNWNITGGTGTYTSTVTVSYNSNMSSPLYTQNVGGSTSYAIPANLQYNRRVYFRVAVDDNDFFANTGLSTTTSFWTLEVPPPTLVTADGLVANSLTPTLEWSLPEYNNNIFFRLLIDDAPGVTDIPANTNVTTGNEVFSAVATGLAPAKKYFWRVAGQKNAAGQAYHGNTYLSSDERYFFTPLPLITPVNGVTGQTLEPTFTWTFVDWASTMRIELSTQSGVNFDANVFFSKDLAGNATTLITDENTTNDLPAPEFPFPLTGNTMYYWRVTAIDGGDEVSSSIHHFTTYPVTSVFQYNPANNDSLFVDDVIFSYGIQGATNGLAFRLQVKAATVEPVKTDWLTSDFDVTTTNLNTTLSLAAGTNYFWRVILLREIAPATYEVMSYSPTSEFKTKGGATLPYPSWPVGAPTVFTNTPTLYWYLMGFGTGLTYQVEVREGSDVGPIAYTVSGITGLFHEIPLISALNPGTTYFWRVKSHFGLVESDWSSFESFTTNGTGTLIVPTQSYPVDDLTIYTTAPYLHWWLGASGDGLDYTIRIGTNPNPAVTFTTEIDNISDLYVQVTGLSQGTTYYWTVRSNNGLSSSAWAPAASFEIVGTSVTGNTVASFPVGGQVVYTDTPTLYWYYEGSTSDLTGYIVRWRAGSNSPDWNTTYTGEVIVNDPNETFAFISTGMSYGVTYYWAVTAVYSPVQANNWAVATFSTVGGAGSGTPYLTHPVGGMTIWITNPTLSWYFNGPTQGIVDYQIQYSYSDVFAGPPPITNVVTSATTQYETSNLLEGATYFWRVRAHYGSSVYSSWSPVDTFFVNPGSISWMPVVGGPNNLTLAANEPVISWFVPGAPVTGSTYYLEVSDNVQFTNPVVFNSLTNNFKAVSGLANNTTYFWRVRSKTADGTFSPYSSTAKFNLVEGVTSVEDEAVVPAEFSLAQNFPNPFNPTTTIAFNIPVDANVTLTIYNALGERVETIVTDFLKAGSYKFNFNASKLTSGVYFYQVSAGEFKAVKKMILMK